MIYLIIMNIVISSNGIDSIIAAQIRTTNSKMVHLYVLSEVENKVKFWTVDQQQIMKACIDR